MTIKEIENKITEEFNLFDDWMDKYNYIIEMGRNLPLIEEKYKTDQYLISGCQSRVWLSAELEDNKIIFKADSDAVITKGIINILIRVLSEQTPDAILNTELQFLNKIGLKEHLSPTRSNGLTSMVKQIKLYAVVFKSKMTHND